MPIPLVHSIASWFLKKRIHQIELFLKYPIEVQNELMLDLTSKASYTEYGKKYGFKSIKQYSDFQSQIPVHTYEDIFEDIERARKGENYIFWPTPIKWFAKSSGTTAAKSKFIPVSTEALEDCHYAAAKDLLCLYLNNNENTQLFVGKGLRLGGSKKLYKENDTFFGDLSAILIDNMPFWAEFSSTPSNRISLMSDWEYKIEAIIKEAINENVTSMAAVPSWMLVLLNKILEHTGKDNLFEIWPNLEVYFHGGVSFVPYRNQFEKLVPSKDFLYYEIYNASEGFFAIQDQNHSDELLLMLDYGIFYEFIPMDTFGNKQQLVVSLSDVNLHTNYAILITTNAGLWRYQIGDTVRFTSLSPYRIKISGRTKHFINVFGEELIVENAEKALEMACSQTQSEIVDYTVGPIFMEGKAKGAHEWLIEFNSLPQDLKQFTILLDEQLKLLNSDYEAKRRNNMTLTLPVVHQGRKNIFQDWLEGQNKLGGQHKIPRLSNSRDVLEALLKSNS